METITDSLLKRISHAFFGYGLAARKNYSFGDRMVGFLVCARPVFMLLTPFNAASAAVLALGGYPIWSQCLLGFCAAAFAAGAINTFNNYVDRERDKHIWQARPIPSGRIKPWNALLMATVFLAASLIITWFFFNLPTFFILLLALILGSLYSSYLRDKVGYLSLPPIVGLIYLGGWAAFSPETLFSSFLPWYLYILGVVWQAAHIMIGYPLHITSDTGNKGAIKIPPAFFFTPSPRSAVWMGIGFTCLTMLLSALMPLLAPLGTLYLVLIIAAGIYALYTGLRLLKDALNRESGLKAFASLTIFRLVISAAILLSILLYQIEGTVR